MDTTPEKAPSFGATGPAPVPTAQPAVALTETVPTTTESTPPVVSPAGTTTTNEPKAPFYKKTWGIIAIIVGLLVVLGGAYYAYTTYYTQGDTVAVVNGKVIRKVELEEGIALIEQSATAQGIDITQEASKKEIRNQAMNVLVNNALLITAAEEAGISVAGSEVQAKYDELVTQLGGEKELQSKMAEVGLTEEKLRSNIEERVLADRLIEAETDIEKLTVTDAEIADFYKAAGAEGAELPPLDEVSTQIKAEILGQKQQKVVEELLTKLRYKSTIEIDDVEI